MTVLSDIPSKGQSLATILDVAQATGYSKATVSKALNLPFEKCPLRFETQQQILEMAKKLGYRPNWRARALATRQTNMIGLLYAPPIPRMDGVYSPIANCFMQELSANGFSLLHLPVYEQSRAWVDMLLDKRIDGCIAFESVPKLAEQILANRPLPIVLTNIESDLPVSRIMVDDRDGAAQATQHLIELGHRRITFFHGPESVDHYSIVQRREGYCEAMRKAGLEKLIDVAKCSTPDFVRERLLQRDRPTAVITYMHYIAVDMVRLLAQSSVQVPRDVSLVTFNDVYPVCSLFPSLTCISLPAEALGRLSAQLLLDQIKKPEGFEPQCVVLKEKLVVRESTSEPCAS